MKKKEPRTKHKRKTRKYFWGWRCCEYNTLTEKRRHTNQLKEEKEGEQKKTEQRVQYLEDGEAARVSWRRCWRGVWNLSSPLSRCLSSRRGYPGRLSNSFFLEGWIWEELHAEEEEEEDGEGEGRQGGCGDLEEEGRRGMMRTTEGVRGLVNWGGRAEKGGRGWMVKGLKEEALLKKGGEKRTIKRGGLT